MSLLVLIDDPKEQYSPGESIIGRVRCMLQNPSHIEVRVKLVREECVYYTTSTDDIPSKTNGDWKHQTLEVKSVLIRSGDVGVGNHEFLFMLTLPSNLPSSYSTKYGHVKFFIKASMSVAEAEDEIDVELKVFSPIDLNNMENLCLVRLSNSEDFVVTLWWFIEENIRMQVGLEKNAFVLGEVMKVAVDLYNASSFRIATVTVKLFLVVQIKKTTFGKKNRSTYHCIVSDEHNDDVLSYHTKSFLSELMIPTNVEIPNFKRCIYFDQKCVLEVTAVLENASKKDLKMEVEVVLGHFPVGKSRGQSKKIKDASYASEAGAIRPLAYGFASFPSKPLESKQSELQSGPLTFEVHNAPYPVPPRPLIFDPKLFLPDVPTHSVAQNTTLVVVPVPVAGSDGKSMPLPVDQPQLYPPQRQSQYPPIEVSEFSSYPKDNFLFSQDRNLPYPSKNICPYPTKESNTGQVTNTRPHPKHKFWKKILHYFNKSSHPGPVEKSKISRPYSDSNNLPYPKEKEKMYSAESCPYPPKATKTAESFSVISHQLCSKEVKGAKVAGPPYPMNSEIRQYPSKTTPYSPKTGLLYPKVDSEGVRQRTKRFTSSFNYPSTTEEGTPFPSFKHSSFEGYDVSDKSEPYLVSNNPPYPKDNTRSTERFASSGLISDKVEGDPVPLLQDSVRNNLHGCNLPYPKESLLNKMPVLPSSFRASFGNKPLPYPSRGWEEAEWPLLPPSAQHSLERGPELPTEMPVPLHSVSSIELTGSSYSTMQSNPPYPVANKSTVAKTAPYPTEKPNPYSTLGFAEFTPMPMPSKGSLILCDFIGFTVPTSTPLKDAKPLPPLKSKMDSDVQPSAVLLSGIKTSPVAKVEKLDNIIKKSIGESQEKKESIPNVHEGTPDISGDVADVRKNVSDGGKDITGISADIPDVLKLYTRILELPTPHASKIETVESQDKSVSSSFEKASNSSKKKQDRPKRKEAVAL